MVRRFMISITDILLQGRPATRDQLHDLFRFYVCDTMCKNVLFDMTERELRRLVSIYIYKVETKGKRLNQGIVRRMITQAIGISSVVLYKYVPAENNDTPTS